VLPDRLAATDVADATTVAQRLPIPGIWGYSGGGSRSVGPVPRASAFEHVRRRTEQTCASALDSRSLRLGLLEAISQVVPFDAYVWLLTDPETSVGTSPVADVPCLHELPRLVRLKYVSDVNHWTALDTVGTAHLSAVRDEAPGETWAGLLSRYGITDVASSVFKDRYGCWGWLDLWRSAGSGRFNDSEVQFLTSLVQVVTSAIRRCQANTFIVRPPGVPRPPGPAVLLLSPGLDVMRVTPESQHYLQILVPPPVGTSPIPANAYNVAAQLLAVEEGANQNRASARVHLSQGHWLTLRAARLAASEPVPQRDIAVTIEESSPGDRLDMFSRSFGMSQRETELLGLLVTGADTRELGRRMLLSEHTVQDHLKNIFAKTSAHNRQTVVARALGQ
jgi:DNA-binding CsgD family transcriptional regulator